MMLRQETPADYAQVEAMVKASFATTSHWDGTEHLYLNELRTKPTFIPELSLVAVKDERIVGQIVLYETCLVGCANTHELLNLSPVSVHVDYFRQGIGTKLIQTGCENAARLGYKAVLLCGDPAYYTRFGFKPSYEYAIYHINDMEHTAQWCMVKELEEGFLAHVKGSTDIL